MKLPISKYDNVLKYLNPKELTTNSFLKNSFKKTGTFLESESLYSFLIRILSQRILYRGEINLLTRNADYRRLKKPIAKKRLSYYNLLKKNAGLFLPNSHFLSANSKEV
ncbi:MAG: hypothetical protein COS15_03890 [Caldiserica bacterium CG02_land_8_20_14_3_00_36_38]|nr:MAG: hypothetical protein AUJ99_00605 [Caldisericum sp. CG2_30_36_11]PIP50121.1 MAG: hypothetical protein COX13_00075 [Caldiserica bacterium CG23_combo_of_CG06-09_8_20_14_all_35_60]PIV55319.1 MAG: hypothetical protein COS15_03890 [Caldiserica bacterium CG02_land_8_20_14_3_00_36_38]